MIVSPPFRHAARVELHLSGGVTRVVLFDLARGDIRQDIPTDKIPLHLRPIGSKFIVILPRFRPEPTDSADDIRTFCQKIEIEELNPGA